MGERVLGANSVLLNRKKSLMSLLTKYSLGSSPELKRIVLAAFGGYRKRDCYVIVSTSCSLTGTYWDGGSRSSYVAVDLATCRSTGAPQYDPPQFGGPSTPHVELPLGVAIVKGGISCGKPATAVIYIHPDNLARLLPAS